MKVDDRIGLGLLIGCLANIPKAALNELLYRRGVETRRYGEIISGVYMPRRQAFSKAGRAFGAIFDFAIASILGVPLVYLLSLSGKDLAPIKGLSIGAMGFGFLRGIIATSIGPGKTYAKDPMTNAVMTGSSMLWGITAGYLASRMGNPYLFEPNKVLQQAVPLVPATAHDNVDEIARNERPR